MPVPEHVVERALFSAGEHLFVHVSRRDPKGILSPRRNVASVPGEVDARAAAEIRGRHPLSVSQEQAVGSGPGENWGQPAPTITEPSAVPYAEGAPCGYSIRFLYDVVLADRAYDLLAFAARVV